MCANQPVFISSSFIFPWPLSQIRRVPSSLLIPLQGSGSRSIQRRSITAFFQSAANFSVARALTEQRLPTLRKVKGFFTPRRTCCSTLCFFSIFLKPLLATLLLGNKGSLQYFCSDNSETWNENNLVSRISTGCAELVVLFSVLKMSSSQQYVTKILCMFQFWET